MRGRWLVPGVVATAIAVVALSGCGGSTASTRSASQPTSTLPGATTTAVSTSTSTSVAPSRVPRSQIPLAPSPRLGASMAFDPATGSVVLFGGLGPYGTTADTWSWDGDAWHALQPPMSATSRGEAAMAYDPISRTVLMLGGLQLVPLVDPCQRPAGRPPVCTPQNETREVAIDSPFWGWDGQEWEARSNASPTPGTQASLVTQADGTVLAFGNGTWTYDGKAWQLRAFAPADLSRPVGIALDPETHRVIAVENYQPGICMPHSGCSKPAYMRTFTWTGSTWKELADRHAPFAGGSPELGQGSLVADPAGGGLLMLATDGSTWRRTHGDWRQVATASESPPVLEGMTLVSDPASRQVVAFGGSSSPSFRQSNVTWVWDGSHWKGLTAPIGSAPIPDPPAVVSCDLNGPSLQGNQAASVGGTVRVTAGNIFITSPCHLQATFTLTLVDSRGAPLAVAGNPSTVNVDTHTPLGSASGVVNIAWSWTNACAGGAVRADIKATGEGAFPTPFPVDLQSVPACHGEDPATLSAAPARIT